MKNIMYFIIAMVLLVITIIRNISILNHQVGQAQMNGNLSDRAAREQFRGAQ